MRRAVLRCAAPHRTVPRCVSERRRVRRFAVLGEATARVARGAHHDFKTQLQLVLRLLLMNYSSAPQLMAAFGAHSLAPMCLTVTAPDGSFGM